MDPFRSMTPNQAYSILYRHARTDIIQSLLQLKQLCKDDDRVAGLVEVYNTTYTPPTPPTTFVYRPEQQQQRNHHHKNNNKVGTTKTTTRPGHNEKDDNNDMNGGIGSSIVENRSWIIDMSRQKMTDVTFNHLLRLASSVQVKEYILYEVSNIHQHHHHHHHHHQQQQQQRLTTTTGWVPCPSQHMALRLLKLPALKNNNNSNNNNNNNTQTNTQKVDHDHQKNESTTSTTTTSPLYPFYHETKGGGYDAYVKHYYYNNQQQQEQQSSNTKSTKNKNIIDEIHQEWNRIELLSNQIRNNENIYKEISTPTTTTSYHNNDTMQITDVIVVGKNVSIQTLQFLYHALCYDEIAIRGSTIMQDDEYNNVSNVTKYQHQQQTTSTTKNKQTNNNNRHDNINNNRTNQYIKNTTVAAANRIRMNISSVTGVVTVAAGGHSNSSSMNNMSVPTMGGVGANTSRIMEPKRRRTLHFLSSLDPIELLKTITNLHPHTTLIISISLTGGNNGTTSSTTTTIEEENNNTSSVSVVTETLKTWLLQSFDVPTPSSTSTSTASMDRILARHMIYITDNDQIAASMHDHQKTFVSSSLSSSSSSSIYIVPSYARYDGFMNFSVVTLVPLAIIFGWDEVVYPYVQGGYDMDKHFVNTCPRHNTPILLALVDVWNMILQQQQQQQLSSSTASQVMTHSRFPFIPPTQSPPDPTNASRRIIQPYGAPFTSYPSFVSALEQKVFSTISDTTTASTVLTNSFSSHIEMITAMNTQLPVTNTLPTTGPVGNVNRGKYGQQHYHHHQQQHLSGQLTAAQDLFMCSFFAHADELAFGSYYYHHHHSHGINKMSLSNPTTTTTPQYRSLASPGMSSWWDTTPASKNHNNDHADDHDHDDISSRRILLDSQQEQQQHQQQQPSSMISGGGGLSTDGNQSSLLLLTSKLDAFGLGQLIALTEHRVLVKARLLGIDPFYVNTTPTTPTMTRGRVDAGQQQPQRRVDRIQKELHKFMNHHDPNEIGEMTTNFTLSLDEEDENASVHYYYQQHQQQHHNNSLDTKKLSLSTKSILQHYAHLIQNERQTMT